MRLLLALLLACPPAVAQELGKLADHLEASSEYAPPPELAERLKTRSEALAATYEVLASQQGCEQDFEVEPLAPADYNAERLKLRDLPEGCERAQVLTRLSRFNKEGKVPLTNAGLSNVEGVCAAYCDGPPSSYGSDYSGSPGYGLGYELGKLMGQGLIAMFGLLAQGLSELGKDRPKAPKAAKAPPPPKPKPEPEKPKVKLTLKADAPKEVELGKSVTLKARLSASRSDFPLGGHTVRFEGGGKVFEAVTDSSGHAEVTIEIVKAEPAVASEATPPDAPISASAAVAVQPQSFQLVAVAGAAIPFVISTPAVVAAAPYAIIAAAAVTIRVLVWQRPEDQTRDNAVAEQGNLEKEEAVQRDREALLKESGPDFGQPPDPDGPNQDPTTRFADQRKLRDHFERHGGDFGAKSESEYVKMASEFFDNARARGYLRKLDKHGTIRIYDPKRTLSDLTPRTDGSRPSTSRIRRNTTTNRTWITGTRNKATHGNQLPRLRLRPRIQPLGRRLAVRRDMPLVRDSVRIRRRGRR